MYSLLFVLSLVATLEVQALGVPPFATKVYDATSALSTGSVPITQNELNHGPCRPITFIFARGSTEAGNIGKDVGGPLAMALKAHYGAHKVAAQGVDYGAKLWANLDHGGCEEPGVSNYVKEIHLAVTKCPHTKIVIGGYSQGAACTHDAAKRLTPTEVSRINAAVTFGDTRKKQGHGMILPIPPSKTKIYCAKGDLVCDGTLVVDPAHLSYATDIAPAAKWIEHMLGSS